MYRVILLLAILSACAQQVAKHADAVPAELVPPGYTAAECRLVEDSGNGGGFSNVGSAMDAGSHTQQRAECNHQTTMVPSGSICRNDKGEDLPAERCPAQKP